MVKISRILSYFWHFRSKVHLSWSSHGWLIEPQLPHHCQRYGVPERGLCFVWPRQRWWNQYWRAWKGNIVFKLIVLWPSLWNQMETLTRHGFLYLLLCIDNSSSSSSQYRILELLLWELTLQKLWVSLWAVVVLFSYPLSELVMFIIR